MPTTHSNIAGGADVVQMTGLVGLLV